MSQDKNDLITGNVDYLNTIESYENIIKTALQIRSDIERLLMYAPDNEAVKSPNLYPIYPGDSSWAYDGKDGNHPVTKVRGRIDGRLYKCIQSCLMLDNWNPENVPSNWAVIDIEHEGTFEDPIPAARGMEYVYGLYYLDPEDENIYLCKRDGKEEGEKEILQFLPHELVGKYFEKS